MATLTIPQIAQLALNAGVQPGNNLYICVAIALAESSGVTDAENSNTNGTKDVGVWQINDVHAQLWTGKQDDRTDPVQNAKYMYSISGGVAWGPWSTYNNGKYQTYLQRAMSAIQQANLSRGKPVDIPNTLGAGYGSAPRITNVLSIDDIPGLSGIKQDYHIINQFFSFITSPDGWVRILKVLAGLVMIITGAILLMKTEVATAVKAVI